MNVTITEKQDKVLTFIRDYYLEKGLAPSLTELQEYMHINTKRGVVGHLEALEKKGFIIRTGGPRGIQLQDEETYEYLIGIPVLGYANAGIPLASAIEDHLGNLKVDKKLLKNREHLFSVILKGDSMNKHTIEKIPLADGNYVIVDKGTDIVNGDTVLAIIDNCATVKVFHKQKNSIALLPNSFNESHQPIYLDKDRENIINGKIIMALGKPKV